MISIQDVGSQILSGNPGKFYVFCGSEYGIKRKYIEILENHYRCKLECESLSDLLSSIKSRKLIQLSNKLYVVRYDDKFLSELNSDVANNIKKLNIPGTIVCIYDTKHVSKLDKFLSEYTVSIDGIDKKYICKYLLSDYPGIPENVIKDIVSECDNYNKAWLICDSISRLDFHNVSISKHSLVATFGLSFCADELTFKHGIASRNFKFLLKCLDSSENQLDSVYYYILSVLLELEKCKSSKYVSSKFSEYANRWSLEDIYNMFSQTYNQLKLSRRTSVDLNTSLVYLFSLLQYNKIPSLESVS